MIIIRENNLPRLLPSKWRMSTLLQRGQYSWRKATSVGWRRDHRVQPILVQVEELKKMKKKIKQKIDSDFLAFRLNWDMEMASPLIRPSGRSKREKKNKKQNKHQPKSRRSCKMKESSFFVYRIRITVLGPFAEGILSVLVRLWDLCDKFHFDNKTVIGRAW